MECHSKTATNKVDINSKECHSKMAISKVDINNKECHSKIATNKVDISSKECHNKTDINSKVCLYKVDTNSKTGLQASRQGIWGHRVALLVKRILHQMRMESALSADMICSLELEEESYYGSVKYYRKLGS